MNLRDAVSALLAQARQAGGNVIAIEAVQGVLDCYDREQKALTLRALERIRPEALR